MYLDMGLKNGDCERGARWVDMDMPGEGLMKTLYVGILIWRHHISSP